MTNNEPLTIDEVLLELEILKEKHGGHIETNIEDIKWISPTLTNNRPKCTFRTVSYRIYQTTRASTTPVVGDK